MAGLRLSSRRDGGVRHAADAGGQGQPGGPPPGTGPQVPNPQKGNFAAAMGIREPGMGMGIDLPGEPVAP